MVQWGYFPGSAKGAKDFLLRVLGHPHPNGRMRAYHVQRLVETGRKTLDIGCGEGIFYYELTKRGCKMFGIDYSMEALENMKKRMKLVSISPRVINADAQVIPIKSKSFDQVICLDVIEHLKDANAAIKGIGRVLRKGGILVLSVPNELYLTKSVLPINFKEHIKAIGHETAGFGYDELKKMLESNGFKIKKYRYYTKFFGRIMTELTFWAIGANNIWKARTKMYDYSYKAFLVFMFTYPILMAERILPNKNGAFLAVKAVKIK